MSKAEVENLIAWEEGYMVDIPQSSTNDQPSLFDILEGEEDEGI